MWSCTLSCRNTSSRLGYFDAFTAHGGWSLGHCRTRGRFSFWSILVNISITLCLNRTCYLVFVRALYSVVSRLDCERLLVFSLLRTENSWWVAGMWWSSHYETIDAVSHHVFNWFWILILGAKSRQRYTCSSLIWLCHRPLMELNIYVFRATYTDTLLI